MPHSLADTPGLPPGATAPSETAIPEIKAGVDKAIDAVFPALVRIEVVMEQGGGGRMKKGTGVGSGSIISADGYVLTNHHVAGRATRISCQLSNHEEVDATLVATDPLSDLAVIKLDLGKRRAGSAPLAVARFGDSDALQVGDSVLAMGCPAGLSQSVTLGIVSNKEMIAPSGMGGMEMDGENVGELVRWIGHDAVIFGGNSGGPLVNLKGEIVGINEIGIGSLGGAIPGNLAKRVAFELIERGNVRRSWIGVEAQPLLQTMDDKDGILVASVTEGSPAAACGIQAGDVLVSFNGSPVPAARYAEDIPIFNRLVLETPIGSKAPVKARRHGMPLEFEISTVDRERSVEKEEAFLALGMTGRNLSRLAMLDLHRASTAGVQIQSLNQSGPTAEAKPPLAVGDIVTRIDGTPVESVKGLRDAVEKITKDRPGLITVAVEFDRDRQKMISAVKLGATPDKDIAVLPERAWLGVKSQVLTRELSTALRLSVHRGIRITEVIPDTGADKAGLKVGDILTHVDGLAINASRLEEGEAFPSMIRPYSVGATAVFDVLRAGEALKITARLDAQPRNSEGYPEYTDKRFEFSTRGLSPSDRIEENLKPPEDGLLVTRVEPSGWAALAGLESADLLITAEGQPCNTIDALKEILAACSERKARTVTLFIKRGIHTRFIEIEPRW